MDNNEFFNLLKEDLINDIVEDDYDNMCLISGNRLNETKVQLLCGHSYNYIPLYKEVINQKRGIGNNLKCFQIKCPYCRDIQNKILPLKELDDVNKIYGVNYPKKYCLMQNKCNIILKSGKRKGEICNRLCDEEMCTYHISYMKKKNKK